MQPIDISRRNFLTSSAVAAILQTRRATARSTGNDSGRESSKFETGVVTFKSNLYSDDQRYAVSATGSDDGPKPLLVVLLPGQYSNLERSAKHCEQIAGLAAEENESVVVIIPGGRGNGTVFQGFGQIDAIEAIDHVSSTHNIDRDRIGVMGGSMGGASTWYMTSHHPDLFSATATFAAYCDYRLWQKPGGYTFPLMEWEEFSWQSRSASDCVENYINTPVWILHGEWDRTIGGGVDVIQSRSMAEKFKELGYDYRYTELKERGHNSYDRSADYFKEVVLWLIKQKRIANPRKVNLVCHELRYNKNRYIGIEQLQEYGRPGRVEAEFSEDAVLSIKTRNVRALRIFPVVGKERVAVVIDGQRFDDVDLLETVRFKLNFSFAWELDFAELNHSKEKHHGASGPFGDIFYERTAIVYGTTGSKTENHMMAQIAYNAAGFYRQWNGGVHRGGIKGDNEVKIPVFQDADIDENLLKNYNLFCIGTPATNAVLARFGGRIPLEFKEREIILGRKSFWGEDVAVITALANPDNPDRYVAVLGGVSADAITWASHLNLALLPDYLVFEKEKVLEWGFFDNNWRI